jgi:hypothetical protein
MTEQETPEAREHLAHRAALDYFNVGPEVGFGELEIEALDDWAEACKDIPLRPSDAINAGWIHVERAWARAAQLGPVCIDQAVPADVVAQVRADLATAANFFGPVRIQGNTNQQVHAGIARLSLPMFDLLLVERQRDFSDPPLSDYILAQQNALIERFAAFKQSGNRRDIPVLDQAIGLNFLTAHFLKTDYVPLPAAYRQSAAGSSSYHQWHALVHDRNSGRTHKVRVAPYGPPDMMLLPPEIFGHGDVPTTHGRATLEGLVGKFLWYRNRKIGQRPTERDTQFAHHIDAVDERIDSHIASELSRLQGWNAQEVVSVEDPVSWYPDLQPFVDPRHAMFGDALETGIAQLEMHMAAETIQAHQLFQLGWMYMESGLSFMAHDTERTAILVASFERAEDIFAQARAVLPAHSSRYYEATISQAAARMSRAIMSNEETDEAVDIYTGQLAIIASQLLEDYGNIPDKTSLEAQTLNLLIQQVTLYLVASRSTTTLALPGSPRERGNESIRGWDFTVWSKESEDGYQRGQFFGRLDDDNDPTAIDKNIIVISAKELGQWAAAHNFKTLRTLLSIIDPSLPQPKNFKPDRKAVTKARTNVLRVFDA